MGATEDAYSIVSIARYASEAGRTAAMAGYGVALARQTRTLRPAVNTSWDTLKILSDPTRLRLLALVMREELSVAELQEILGMGQSRISSQLALLRQASLVVDRRDGKKAFYSLRPEPARRAGWRSSGRRRQRRRPRRHRRGRPPPGPRPRQAPPGLRAVLQPDRRPPRAQPLPRPLVGGDRAPGAAPRPQRRRRGPRRRRGADLAAPRPQREAGVVHRQFAADGRGRHRARPQERPVEPHLQAGRHRAGAPPRRVGGPGDPQPGPAPRHPSPEGGRRGRTGSCAPAASSSSSSLPSTTSRRPGTSTRTTGSGSRRARSSAS